MSEEEKEEIEGLDEEEQEEKAPDVSEKIEGEEDNGKEETEGEVDDKKVDDKPKETPKFTLSDTPAEVTDEKVEKIEIVHNGQVYNLTKDKIVELAQKGFDYDFKVGPHGKLAQMIESDPKLSKVVDDYWQGKVEKKDEKFVAKPMSDYQDEEVWLQDNLQRAITSFQESLPEIQPKPQPETPTKESTAKDALRMRDPAFFNQIYPKLDKYAEQLTMSDYRKVDSDMASLFQFYDFVKAQELDKTESPDKTKKVNTPGFRVKSGGGDVPKTDDVPPAWKLSKKDFQKQLDKIKGYS
jgi:hypothetical protein